MSSHNFTTNEKSKEDYMMEFVVKTNMIDSIVGKSDYHMVRVIRLAVDNNLKAMKERRGPKYRKLYLIKDVLGLQGGPANPLPVLIDQGLSTSAFIQLYTQY